MDYPHKEQDLVRALGIERDALRGARKDLEEGPDWSIVAKAVCYSRAGYQRLIALLGIPDAEPPKKYPVLRSVCTGLHREWLNKKIIQCRLGDGSLIRVKVADSDKYTRGMKVPVIADTTHVYRLGRAEPREKGKW